jgi:hypothetical protein
VDVTIGLTLPRSRAVGWAFCRSRGQDWGCGVDDQPHSAHDNLDLVLDALAQWLGVLDDPDEQPQQALSASEHRI